MTLSPGHSPRLTSPASPSDGDDLVVRRRFIAPKLRSHVVARPRLDDALSRLLDHPLTIVRGEAGYGKTTAVASYLDRAGHSPLWYHAGDTEADPRIFLLHLIHVLASKHSGVGARAIERLLAADRSTRSLVEVVDAFSNDLLDLLPRDTILVLDDYDRVDTPAVNALTERLVEAMPPQLHVVITARTMPSLRGRARWRASGEMIEITRSDLAFTTDEVTTLFQTRLGRALPAGAAESLAAETEGWPIALQMLSENVASGTSAGLDRVLQGIPGSSDLLFDYLADEVFLRQPPDVQTFLSESASLRWLDADLCDAALGREGSATLIRFLESRSLFLTSEGAMRYHNLFADFLLRRGVTSPDRRAEIHRRAGDFFLALGRDDDAVHHLLAAGDHERAADILESAAPRILDEGRHHSLGRWLEALPPGALDSRPQLLLARAETWRLASRYMDALPVYDRARAALATRGDRDQLVSAIRAQALVYLDTVQPAGGARLLREGFRAARGNRAERATMYALLVENTLNAGDTRRARRMLVALRRFATSPDPAMTEPRLLVREGQLVEARQMLDLKGGAEAADGPSRRVPRSHREVSAILAWIEALTGESEQARVHAAESLETGRSLGSPVVECVALARLGFAWLVGADFDAARARETFDDSLRAAQRLGVARFQVEALLGLVIITGIERRHEEALTAAREALRILDAAGDRYLSAVVSVALGAALTLASRDSAEEWLLEGARVAGENGDQFTETVAGLWLAMHRARRGETSAARPAFLDALRRMRAGGYEFLLGGRSLLGPRETSLWRGLMRRAREDAELGDYARALSAQFDGGFAERGPSYARPGDAIPTAELYVQTFGPFRVWRQGQEIERGSWGREKALHLFQLLVSHREQPLHRDQIIEELWPESPTSAATTGLRVALSALRSALEPARAARADSLFIRRDGDTILLATEAGIRIDADEFQSLLRQARAAEPADAEQAITLYEQALSLYRGDYLVETPYSAWAERDRQRWRAEMLSSGERLGRLLLRAGEAERAGRWAEIVLQHDPVWEGAYVVLMEAHWRQGNRPLAVRAFERCRKRLKEALGVSPSPGTVELMGRIAG